MSFISSFGAPPRSQPTPPPPKETQPLSNSPRDSQAPTGSRQESPTPRTRTGRANSIRPASMVGAYQPPLMEIAHDTIPELLPIFTFLNSHSNKLYQEGYFLKLNDLDSRQSSPIRPVLYLLTRTQTDGHLETGHGRNALLSWLEQSSLSGMRQHWMQLVRMERLLPPLSTWRMHRSKW